MICVIMFFLFASLILNIILAGLFWCEYKTNEMEKEKQEAANKLAEEKREAIDDLQEFAKQNEHVNVSAYCSNNLESKFCKKCGKKCKFLLYKKDYDTITGKQNMIFIVRCFDCYKSKPKYEDYGV